MILQTKYSVTTVIVLRIIRAFYPTMSPHRASDIVVAIPAWQRYCRHGMTMSLLWAHYCSTASFDDFLCL